MTGRGGGDAGALPPGPDASRTSKTLAVTLVDVLGNPVEGATLTLTIGNFKRSEVSAADGVATFDFAAFGAYSLAAKTDGFESLSVDGIRTRRE
jgi:hypothetical protein